MNKSKLNVAVIGLGTVGSGVIKLLRKQKNNIKKRTGIELKVVAVSAKNRRKQRSVDISPFRWIASPITIAKDPSVDVIVELIGDMDNTARKIIIEAVNTLLQQINHFSQKKGQFLKSLLKKKVFI